MKEHIESSIVFGYTILSRKRPDGLWHCRVVGVEDIYAVAKKRFQAEQAVRSSLMRSKDLLDRIRELD